MLLKSGLEKIFKGKDFTLSSLALVDYVPAELIESLDVNEKRKIAGFPALEVDKDAPTTSAVQELGVGGTVALIDLLANETISKKSKVQTLVKIFGRSEDDAKLMVYGTIEAANADINTIP